MDSAFGVEHSTEISKSDALGSVESTLRIAHDAGEHSGKSFMRCPKCSPGKHAANGPGSQRGRMDPRAWESRMAAHRRANG